MRKKILLFLMMFTWVCVFVFMGQENTEMVNLLSLQEGTLPVIVPPSYGCWPAEGLLDESPDSGWSSEFGQTKNHVFVFEMLSPAVIELFEFDNAAVDDEGASAKDVTVEVSSQSRDSGFETVLQATLANKTDHQRFKPTKLLSTRWIRLTIHSNHGSKTWTELLSFRGYGVKPKLLPPIKNLSGTYEANCSRFHLRQQGTDIVGCYEYNEGLLDGGIEGRLMKITWQEGEKTGPAIMVFSNDGKSFRGFWWNKGKEKEAPCENWEGKKVSSRIGSCPHLVGALGGEMKKKLSSEGWPRAYSILFDLNSAVILPESKGVLDEVLNMLNSEPEWNLTIEGNTDSTGNASYNQLLSQQRAEAVKSYLAAAGIKEERLQIKVFGSSRPVADNASELGRALNRRVELIRQ